MCMLVIFMIHLDVPKYADGFPTLILNTIVNIKLRIIVLAPNIAQKDPFILATIKMIKN